MSESVIRVQNLSKRYHLGASRRRHDTLRDQLADAFLSPFRQPKRNRRRNHSDAQPNVLWALKDVSFEVKRGEVVGIIGRNGAGKTTLLKVLSRITEPTKGRAEIRGRVGSLLEVGTGFHRELTGRENIFLNGAILGMKRAEIAHKFDEIVAFSEVEKLLDTPMKHYSTGMYVRLAFAVAAHLDPEILLVDEVLAVGDAAFQKKCLGKMGEVARRGRTVLFVSHNLGQIKRLCSRGLWLSEGMCLCDAPVDDAVVAYQSSLANSWSSPATSTVDAAKAEPGFISWGIVSSPGVESHVIHQDGPFTLKILLRIEKPVRRGYHRLLLRTADGTDVADWSLGNLSLSRGIYEILYDLPGLPVHPGIYRWFVTLWDGGKKVDLKHLYPELIVATQEYSGPKGIINMPCDIHIKALPERNR